MTCLKPEHARAKYRQTCLGSTCMKWAPSGELSDVDLNMILEKLARVDPNLSGSKDAEGLSCSSQRRYSSSLMGKPHHPWAAPGSRSASSSSA